jgi:predicted nuclease of predicted toxin-antitoxin system
MPSAVRDWLLERRPDWDVAHIFDVGLMGSPDSDILAWARYHSYVTITFDEDFPDGRRLPLPPHCGIIRLTGGTTTLGVAREQLERLFSELNDADLPGSLVIVGPSRIRVIPGPLPRINP